MKVLHIGPKNFPPSHGGVEKLVYDLVSGMADVESHILVEWPQEPLPTRVQVLPRGLWRQFKAVRAYVGRHGIDLIHLHKERSIPLAILLRLAGRQCLLTLHGCAWRQTCRSWPIRATLFGLDCLACFLLPIVFVSQPDWQMFRKLPGGTKHLIPNGVEMYEESACAVSPQAARRGLVYLGRLSPEKNILNLIRAAEQAQVDLDLYGPFDLRNDAFNREVLQALEAARYARWKGSVAFDQVRLMLRQYRALVNPSYSEGMPVSVLEAAAEGLYLVLSDIPPHRLLEMPQATCQHPDRLDFGSLPPLDQLDGRANRTHAQEHFSLRDTIRKYCQFYEAICQ